MDSTLTSAEHVMLTMENYRTRGMSSLGYRTKDEAIMLEPGEGIACNQALSLYSRVPYNRTPRLLLF